MLPDLPRGQVGGTGMQHTKRCSIARVLCREQAEQDAKMEEAIAKAAEELIDKFEEQWKPAMENLEEAEAVFDDLDGKNCQILLTSLPSHALCHRLRLHANRPEGVNVP